MSVFTPSLTSITLLTFNDFPFKLAADKEHTSASFLQLMIVDANVMKIKSRLRIFMGMVSESVRKLR